MFTMEIILIWNYIPIYGAKKEEIPKHCLTKALYIVDNFIRRR